MAPLNGFCSKVEVMRLAVADTSLNREVNSVHFPEGTNHHLPQHWIVHHHYGLVGATDGMKMGL